MVLAPGLLHSLRATRGSPQVRSGGLSLHPCLVPELSSSPLVRVKHDSQFQSTLSEHVDTSLVERLSLRDLVRIKAIWPHTGGTKGSLTIGSQPSEAQMLTARVATHPSEEVDHEDEGEEQEVKKDRVDGDKEGQQQNEGEQEDSTSSSASPDSSSNAAGKSGLEARCGSTLPTW